MTTKKSRKDFPKGFSEYSPPYPPKKPESTIQTYFEQEVFSSDSYGEIVNVDDLISALLAFKAEMPNTELHYRVKNFDPVYIIFLYWN